MSVQIIKNIVFYKLSDKQLKSALAIQNVIKSYDIKINLSFDSSEFIAKENLNGSALLVSNEDHANELFPLMFEQGAPFFVPWEKFKASYYDILKLRKIKSSFSVILAFLPPVLNNTLDSIFKLYGYNVIVTDNFTDLQKSVSADASYIVLNQDLNLLPKTTGKPAPKKEAILRYLKSVKVENQDIGISVIKDFNQGSLFDDISSSVKTICNLLLSPEEYILFIKRFLYEYTLKKILDFYEIENSTDSIRFLETGKIKNDKMFIKLLKDNKKIYKEIIDRTENSKVKTENAVFEQYCEDLKSLQLKNSLLKWIPKYFNRSEDKKNRASFSFIDESAASLDKFIQLTSKGKEKPRENKTSTPVSRSIDFPDLTGFR